MVARRTKDRDAAAAESVRRGVVYHVYNRAEQGDAPFKLEDEAGRFWSLLQEVKKRDGLAVLAWCIMPHHYHLAVRAGSLPLWRSIRFLQHAYTRGSNRRCKVLGPLWQARYKAPPVQGTDSLLRLLACVHLNPVTAKIVGDPATCRWSGDREFLRWTGRPLIDADLVDSFCGGIRRQALHSNLSLVKRERNERWVAGRLEQLPRRAGEPAYRAPTQRARSEAGRKRRGVSGLHATSATCAPCTDCTIAT